MNERVSVHHVDDGQHFVGEIQMVSRLVKVDIVLQIYSGVRYSPCVHT